MSNLSTCCISSHRCDEMWQHLREITLVVAVNMNTSKTNMRPTNMTLRFGMMGSMDKLGMFCNASS